VSDKEAADWNEAADWSTKFWCCLVQAPDEESSFSSASGSTKTAETAEVWCARGCILPSDAVPQQALRLWLPT